MSSIIKTLTASLLAFLLGFSLLSVRAEGIIGLEREEAGESYTEYPLLSGFDNTLVQDSINARILQEVQPHLNTLLVLSAGGPGSLRLDSEYLVFPSADGHDILNILLTAEGRMPSGRGGHQYIPLMFDLANGQAVDTTSFWLDPAAARERLTEITRNEFEETLSNYLNIEDLFPLPLDRTLLTDTGISFYYPENTLTWLSGRSASIHFLYHELEEFLALGDESILGKLEIKNKLTTQGDSAQKIEETALKGALPGFDIKNGDRTEKIIAEYRLMYDPEGFPGGESHQLEDDRFRGTTLISADNGQITGILSKRMNLFGLISDRTLRTDTLSLLGEPLTSVPLDAAAAALYRLEPGIMDSYPFGANELRLHYDSGGVLAAIWLNKAK